MINNTLKCIGRDFSNISQRYSGRVRSQVIKLNITIHHLHYNIYSIIYVKIYTIRTRINSIFSINQVNNFFTLINKFYFLSIWMIFIVSPNIFMEIKLLLSILKLLHIQSGLIQYLLKIINKKLALNFNLMKTLHFTKYTLALQTRVNERKSLNFIYYLQWTN